jgi:hypothetical protein
MSGRKLFFLIHLEKWEFCQICDNLPISLIDSSETKGHITKGKLNNDSPNLFLLEKIEIFMMRIH